MRTLSVAGKEIEDSSSAYVIAEIGHNRGGSLEHVKIMFRLAMEAGASAVKLQKAE